MYFDGNGTFGKKIISKSIKLFKKIGKFIGETVESSVQYTKTVIKDFKYYIFATTETGVQIDLDTSTGKVFNFSINTPSNPWNFWEYSFGLDVKVKGVGFGVGIGGENSLSLHWKKSTFSVFGNALGRIGFETKTDINDYSSNYSRLSFNAPEILAIGALMYFAAPVLIPLSFAAFIITTN
ncbi:hypothetical protein [Haploplasma modicum]|uniref:hypothetical protein n=1 Tax=Haploplasma modicum TaxID=2150 RepID=UPI00138AD32F|nr:hypothetical protein [Haploplasma modicum]